MTTPRAIIRDVAALIIEPSRWCQGALARRANGKPCRPKSGAAWDAIGAVYRVTNTEPANPNFRNELSVALAGMQMAASIMHGCSLERVNDTMGHAAVMNVLRLARKLASDEPVRPRG